MPYLLHVAPERAVSRPLWDALLGRTESATIADLHRASRAHPNAIQLRLKRWERAGLVRATPPEPIRYAAAPGARRPVRADSLVAPIWNALRADPALAAEIAETARAHPPTVETYLRKWARCGLVTTTGGGPRRFMLFPSVPETDAADPRPAEAAPPATARQRLWSAIRILKRFDLPVLMIAAEATRRSAEDYINLLLRSGYLVNERRGNPTQGSWSTYCLVRRSGPLAPSFGHGRMEGGRACRTLRDPNDGRTAIIPPARSRSASDAKVNFVPAVLNHAR